jgi:hypothetical protein
MGNVESFGFDRVCRVLSAGNSNPLASAGQVGWWGLCCRRARGFCTNKAHFPKHLAYSASAHHLQVFLITHIFSSAHEALPSFAQFSFDNIELSIDPPTPDSPTTTAVDLPIAGRISRTLTEQFKEFYAHVEKLQTLPAQFEKLQTQVEKLQTQMEKMQKSVTKLEKSATKLEKSMRDMKNDLNVTILDAIHGQKRCPSKTS